jgi:hypothetical protein
MQRRLDEGVGVAEADERSMLRPRNQSCSGLEHHDARAFGADECARHVESILRKELIEVVANTRRGMSGKRVRISGA